MAWSWFWVTVEMVKPMARLAVMNSAVPRQNSAKLPCTPTPNRTQETSRITDLTDSNLDEEFWKIVREEEHYDELNKPRIIEEGDALAIFRLPEFDISESMIEGVMDIARKHKALIIDLRGNPGGSVETLRALVGSVFDSEVKINDRVGRDKSKDKTCVFKV